MGLKRSIGSGAALVAKRHVKFGEDADESFHTADEGNSTLQPNDELVAKTAPSDDESESDEDDAPEEEGMSDGKSLVDEQLKKREEALLQQEQYAKDKRRRNEKVFKQQRMEKKQKQEAKAKMLAFEAKLKDQMASAVSNDDAEELSEEFFDQLDEKTPSATIETKPTHINFNDIDENFTATIKEEIKKQKKRTLRELRKTELQKGPVTVNVLSSIRISKTLAPKKETSVTKSKDKWLKRRSLKRK